MPWAWTISKLMLSLVFYRRWALIAGHLPGRTDNEIKNYWNSHLSRRVYSYRMAGGEVETVPVNLGKLAAGGRVSRSAMKKNTMNIGIGRREKDDEMMGVGISTSSARTPSDEGHRMVPDQDQDQHQASCVTFDGLKEGDEEIITGLLSTGPMECGLWGANTEMEAMHFGATEESSVGWGSHEERESGGVMSSSDQEREGRRGLVLNGNGDDVNMGLEEGRGSGIDKFLDWDLGGIDAKLWDETGEMWPWQWDSVSRELGLQQVEDGGWYQEESLEGWLLSDVL